MTNNVGLNYNQSMECVANYLTVVFGAKRFIVVGILREIVGIVLEIGRVNVSWIRGGAVYAADASTSVISLHFVVPLRLFFHQLNSTDDLQMTKVKWLS